MEEAKTRAGGGGQTRGLEGRWGEVKDKGHQSNKRAVIKYKGRWRRIKQEPEGEVKHKG